MLPILIPSMISIRVDQLIRQLPLANLGLSITPFSAAYNTTQSRHAPSAVALFDPCAY